MKEFRSLEAKRLAQGLTAEEEARYAELRDLVGPEAAAPKGRGGFDVNAAAALLRESLLPGGLRNRPPAVDPVAAPAPPAEPERAPFDPFAPLPGEEPMSLDPDVAPAPLDADSFAREGAHLGAAESVTAAGYDLGAAYDPNAAYDPSAAAYDPNAPYDPNAAAYDPNAPPYDPNAAAYDPNAPPYDPNAAAYDPNAPPYDPNAAAYDPNALYDPNAAYAAAPAYEASAVAQGAPGWDPSQVAFDAGAAAEVDPAAPGEDPDARPWDPGASPADQEAAERDLAAPADASAEGWDAGAAYEANAPAAGGGDAAAADAWSGIPVDGDVAAQAREWGETAEASGPDMVGSAFDSVLAPTPGEVDAAGGPGAGATEAAPEEAAASGSEGAWDAGALADEAADAKGPLPADATWSDGADPLAEPPIPPVRTEPDAAELPPQEWFADASPAAPGPALPLGEYDENGAAPSPVEDAGLASMLPFDAASAAAVQRGSAPEGFNARMGEYDDAAAFASPGSDATPADLPQEPDGSGFHAAQEISSGETEGWQPDAVLDDGFSLASGGSFDAADSAAVPEWASGSVPPAPWQSPEPAEHSPPAAIAPRLASPGPSAETISGTRRAAPLVPELAEPSLEAGGEPMEAAAEAPEVPAAEAEAPEPAAPVPAAEAAPPEPAAPESMPEAAVPETAAAAPVPTPLPELEEPTPAVPAPLPAPDAVDDFAVDVEEPAPTPELDFSRPDLSAGLDDEGQPLAGEGSIDISFDDAPPAAPASAAAPEAAAPAAPSPEGSPAASAKPARPAAPEEELPTIDGEEILEEIPARDAAPAAAAAAPAASAATTAPPREEPGPPVPPPVPPGTASSIAAAPSPPKPPFAAPSPECRVAGVHRVVVHTLEGQVKRGVLEDAALDAASLSLVPQPGSKPESLATEKVKAIFFMLAPGETVPQPAGKKVRVTFRDGRQIAGFSPEYREEGAGFFMLPGDARTNTGRIWVYRAAVRQVAVS